MNREEAKEIFLNRGWVKVNGGEIFDGNLWRQSLVVISEWLKEQEPCEDAISRQTILDTMSELNAISFYESQEDSNECYHEIRKVIEQLPSVTPKQKIGLWIENAPEYQNIDPPYICSECGNMHLRKTNYCDQCGAKMGESEET